MPKRIRGLTFTCHWMACCWAGVAYEAHFWDSEWHRASSGFLPGFRMQSKPLLKRASGFCGFGGLGPEGFIGRARLWGFRVEGYRVEVLASAHFGPRWLHRLRMAFRVSRGSIVSIASFCSLLPTLLQFLHDVKLRHRLQWSVLLPANRTKTL